MPRSARRSVAAAGADAARVRAALGGARRAGGGGAGFGAARLSRRAGAFAFAGAARPLPPRRPARGSRAAGRSSRRRRRCATISLMTPSAGAGTSSTTLSVSRSTRFSSRRTASPAFLCQATSVASATDSGNCGTLTSMLTADLPWRLGSAPMLGAFTDRGKTRGAFLRRRRQCCGRPTTVAGERAARGYRKPARRRRAGPRRRARASCASGSCKRCRIWYQAP